jgi:hypothetical protein
MVATGQCVRVCVRERERESVCEGGAGNPY